MSKCLQNDIHFHNLLATLNNLARNQYDDFSGLGLLVYDDEFIRKERFISLKHESQIPSDLKIGNSKTLDYLAKVSSKNHLLHDGFIFINNQGYITHVAQYIEVRIIDGVKPHFNHGTRYLSSMMASMKKDVKYIGNVTSDYKKYVFVNGECFVVSDNLELEEVRA